MSVATATSLAAHARTAVLAVAEDLLPAGGARIVGAYPSVTNYVFILSARDGTRFVAKYGLLGRSLPTVLLLHAGSDMQGVLRLQREYLRDRPRLALEHEQLRRLDQWMPGLAPTPVGYAEGVLLLRHVAARMTLTDLLARHDDLDGLLAMVLAVSDRVHALIANDSVREFAERFPLDLLRSDISRTFLRKFGGGSPTAGSPEDPRRGPGLPWEAAGWGPRLLGGIAAELRELGCRPADGLLFGDLKPEHVLFGATGKVCLLDPSVHAGRRSADLARFLARTMLVGHTLEHGARERVGAALARVFLQRACTPDAHAEVGLLIVADLMNILSTYGSLPAAHLRRQPGHVRAAARRAPHLAQRLAATAGALLGRHAAGNAVAGLLATCGRDRGGDPSAACPASVRSSCGTGLSHVIQAGRPGGRRPGRPGRGSSVGP
jgi:hypothetical protein